MKFNQLATEYLESPEYQGLAKTTKTMYESNIKRLIEIGGSLPIIDAPMQNDVARSRSRSLSSMWFDRIDRIKDGTNVIKLASRTALSIVYKWAVVRGYLRPGENPVPYINKRTWAHTPAEKKPFTFEEVQAIEEGVRDGVVTGDLIAYAYLGIIAWDLGCRPEELYKHQSKWFAKRDGDLYMAVYEAKGKPVAELSRYILLGERAKRILNWFRTQPTHRGHDHFTFRNDGGRAFQQSEVCTKFKRVCTLVNVEERAFYNTRRGLATDMAKQGQTIEDIATRLGNSPAVVRKHYIVMDEITKAKMSQPMRQRIG